MTPSTLVSFDRGGTAIRVDRNIYAATVGIGGQQLPIRTTQLSEIVRRGV